MAHLKQKVKTGILAGGIAAALLATAGSYLLYASPKGRARRRKFSSWMVKFKREVIEGMQRTEEWNKAAFEKVVDAATKRYSALKDIDPEELRSLAHGIKKQWVTFSKILGTKKSGHRTTTQRRKVPR